MKPHHVTDKGCRYMLSVLEAPILCWRKRCQQRCGSCRRFLSAGFCRIGVRVGLRVVVEEFTDSEGTMFESMFPLMRSCALRAPLGAAVVPEGATASTCGPNLLLRLWANASLVWLRGRQRQAHQRGCCRGCGLWRHAAKCWRGGQPCSGPVDHCTVGQP